MFCPVARCKKATCTFRTTFRRHRVALRACFWRFVMWKWQRVQSVKRSVKLTVTVSLMIRRTTLKNCLRRWETGLLHRVRSNENAFKTNPHRNASKPFGSTAVAAGSVTADGATCHKLASQKLQSVEIPSRYSALSLSGICLLRAVLGVQSVKLSVTSTLWSHRTAVVTALRICLEKIQRWWKTGTECRYAYL